MARTSIWFSTAVLIWATTSVATMGQTPIVIGEPQVTYPEPIDLDAWIEGQGSGGYYPENGCYPSGDCYPVEGCQLDGFFNNGCGGCFGLDSLLGGHYSGNSQANSTLHAPWSWQLLPRELIYRPQLASLHTARMAVSALNIRGFDPVGLPAGTHWYWDSTLGARIGIVRFGSPTGAYPQGFQFDVEGAIFPRQNSNGRMLIATDYRVGLPVSFGWRRYQTKFGFYHVSSHMGDEYILSNPPVIGPTRINYVRNSIVWSNSYQWTQAIRTYIDASWAFNLDGGAKPWQFQFGAEYSPLLATGFRGAPFVAANGHILQALNYGGNFVFQTGWQWRGRDYGPLLRFGFQYLEGMTPRYEFFRNNERELGMGIWYDF